MSMWIGGLLGDRGRRSRRSSSEPAWTPMAGAPRSRSCSTVRRAVIAEQWKRSPSRRALAGDRDRRARERPRSRHRGARRPVRADPSCSSSVARRRTRGPSLPRGAPRRRRRRCGPRPAGGDGRCRRTGLRPVARRPGRRDERRGRLIVAREPQASERHRAIRAQQERREVCGEVRERQHVRVQVDAESLRS